MGHAVSKDRLSDPFYAGASSSSGCAVYPSDLNLDMPVGDTVSAVLKLYGTDRKNMSKALHEYYAPDAIFNDHFVYIQGRDNIVANNIFWTRAITQDNVKPFAIANLGQGASKAHRPDCFIISIYHTGNCTWSLLTDYLGLTYVLYATAVLAISAADGKILEHRDVYHNIPFQLPTFIRKLFGVYMVALMKVVLAGWDSLGL